MEKYTLSEQQQEVIEHSKSKNREFILASNIKGKEYLLSLNHEDEGYGY